MSYSDILYGSSGSATRADWKDWEEARYYAMQNSVQESQRMAQQMAQLAAYAPVELRDTPKEINNKKLLLLEEEL